MERRKAIQRVAAGLAGLYLAPGALGKMGGAAPTPGAGLSGGPFLPDWHSLQQYRVPDWFRNAKFGIWAHWGPQCQPERGDWYARGMYQEGSDQYKFHCEHYGHPSKFGFKDVIHTWKAEHWDPDHLLSLYKKAGARYFMALANHHDNFDNFNSRYQPWNAVRLGPKKDLIGGWARAARRQGLHFAVSVHASHAWTWYEPSQLADTKGPMKGLPYDGNMLRAQGAGQWWEAYDPQDLYAQRHLLSSDAANPASMGRHWNWLHGASRPSEAYLEKFYNRVIDLIDQHHPDMLYFDDWVLPFHPISDVGLRIAAYYYNSSIQRHGSLQAVINGKSLTEGQRRCMVWDIERGRSNSIEPLPWQTDTCLGHWHYDRPLYERKGYRQAGQVLRDLVDVVSKNGNLMLSVPVRGDGTIDELEQAIVEEIGDWMRINGQAIYDSRPWKEYGEGPAFEAAKTQQAANFNEGKGPGMGGQDIRFMQKGKRLFAFVMGPLEGEELLIHSLGRRSALCDRKVERVKMLDGRSPHWQQGDDSLRIQWPAGLSLKYPVAIEIV